jgi:hypothetical protein
VIYGSPSGLTVTDPSVPESATFDFRQSFLHRDGHVAAGAKLGQALASGDFNHDGAGDLAMGAPGYTLDRGLLQPQNSEAGAVWILYGAKKTPSTTGGLRLTANLLIQESDLGEEEVSGDHFGAALTAGDFNGDTYFDLAVGAPDKNSDFGLFSGGIQSVSGVAYVIHGSSLGLDDTEHPDVLDHEDQGVNFVQPPNRYGAALTVGDFDGDGFADLAIGSPTSDTLSATSTSAGFVQVYYGSSSGWGLGIKPRTQQWDQVKLGGSNNSGDRFGSALAAGDFNGDGRADLAIGAPLKDVNGLSNVGEVYVIYGASTVGLSSAVHSPQGWLDIGLQAGARFGSSLTAWNFGRNECSAFGCGVMLTTADLAIGSPYKSVDGISGAGAVTVLYGSVANHGLTGLNANSLTASSIGFGSLAGAHFGSTVY